MADRKRRVIFSFFSIYFSLLFLLAIIFFSYYLEGTFHINSYRKEIETLNKKFLTESVKFGTVTELQMKNSELLRKLSLYKKEKEKRVIWANKLAALNLFLPEEMWISKLYLEKGKEKEKENLSLIVQGYLSSSPAQEAKIINNYIERLNRTPLWGENLESTRLVSIKEEKINHTRVLAFQLSSPLKIKEKK